MEVVVLGAGAIGSFIGISLANILPSGYKVTLIKRSFPVGASEGIFALRVTDLDNRDAQVSLDRFNLIPSLTSEIAQKCDFLLVCVKATENETVARKITSLIRRETIIISLQNGLDGAHLLKKEFPENIVLKGMIGFNVIAKGIMHFHRGTSSPLILEYHPSQKLRTFIQVRLYLWREIRTLLKRPHDEVCGKFWNFVPLIHWNWSHSTIETVDEFDEFCKCFVRCFNSNAISW